MKRFSQWLFRGAGIYGLLLLTPQYWLEAELGRDQPPPITHPEFFYGFLGVAIAWQLAFLVIGQDPLRYRPLMLPAMVEKGSFGLAAVALYWQDRLAPIALGFGCADLALGLLFVVAYSGLRGVENRSAWQQPA